MNRWLILGTDERLKKLARKLSHDYPSVYYKSVDKWTDECNDIFHQFNPDIIVLPIQPLAIETPFIPNLQNKLIFAGKLNDSWRTLLQNTDIIHYLEDESFIWQNAKLTAEAFIAFFHNSKKAINGKKFIVTGFGRVAKMLSHMLRQIGGEVTIAVKSHIQLNEAKAFFYEAIHLDEIHKAEGDFIINTIPAKWLTKSLFMPLFDLASAPGCLADEVDYPEYVWLPALPGKYFPEDAAAILHKTIVSKL